MELTSARFHRLPLRGLAVFEAAARHGQFTTAATELAVTPARVSQHIAELEEELGLGLFVRRHRGVELTVAGDTLLRSVRAGLGTLSEGIVRTRRLAARKTLRILTDYGFAAWWLMPRLDEIGAMFPEFEVRVATTQAEVDATDPDFDLAIMFGHGDWAGFRSTPLFREEVVPVCSPAYLGSRTIPMTADAIAGLRLLHLRGLAKARWYTWDDWLGAHGVGSQAGQNDLAFDNFQLVLQAALLGQGVCIGWTPLIDDLVDGGGLVRLSAAPLYSARGYHIVEQMDGPGTPAVEALKAWLLSARRQPHVTAIGSSGRSPSTILPRPRFQRRAS
jgi:LysR family glycine cleavage system transcriptional activator